MEMWDGIGNFNGPFFNMMDFSPLRPPKSSGGSLIGIFSTKLTFKFKVNLSCCIQILGNYRVQAATQAEHAQFFNAIDPDLLLSSALLLRQSH